MSYEKQNFVNNQNLTADHLNHIENGIENLENNKANKKDLYYDDRTYDPVVYSYDGNRANKEIYSPGSDMYFVKIAEIDHLVTIDEMKGFDMTLTEVREGQTVNTVLSEIYDENTRDQLISAINGAPGVFSFAEYIMVVSSDIDPSLNFPLTKGIWILQSHNESSNNGFFVSTFKMKKHISGELKLIDDKFINFEYKVENKIFTLEDGTEVTAEAGAEAFNGSNTAVGKCSHAEGVGTLAMSHFSHSEGYKTCCTEGIAAHSEGYATIARGNYQHVQGKCNIEDKNNVYAHIVGNGLVGEPSNAHTLDWNGNAWFAGKVTANGTPSDANDLVTKQYVDALAVNNAIMNIAHIEEIDAFIEENNIYVLDYKYQRVNMFNNANIILPEVDAFTKIHLYFDTTEDLVINLSDCRKKQLPEILANKSYELVATYNMNYWLVEINVFE